MIDIARKCEVRVASNLTLLPFIVHDAITMDGFCVVSDPGGAVLAVGLVGHLAGSNEPILLTAYESKVEDWTLNKLPRTTIEQMVFSMFATAHEALGGTPSYRVVGPGADPPDLVVTRGKARIEMELTQLADEGRRQAISRLRLVEAGVDNKDLQLPRLKGWSVFLWGEDLGVQDFSGGHADEIVDLLTSMDPRDHLVSVPAGEGLPATLPQPEIVKTPRGTRVLAAPPGNLPISTRFASRRGFELGLAYTSETTLAAALDQLRTVIAGKDGGASDELLITFGAPGPDGFRWPAEQLLYGWLGEHGAPEIQTQHLKRVYLYNWNDGYVELRCRTD